MKQLSFLLGCTLLVVGCNTSSDKPAPITKDQLEKVQWIEGNWLGMDGEKPFFEIYKFLDDSTIEITGYDWNGTDSSNSTQSFLAWKTGQYYLGDSLNYKVTEITDSSISMEPNYKVNNSILWKTKNENAWIAILKSKKGEKTYNMRRITHFTDY